MGRALRRWSLRLLAWGLVALIWLGIGGAVALTYVAYTLPPIENVAALQRAPHMTMIGADGQTFARLGQAGGQPIRVEALPPHVPNAVIAIEDRRFQVHFGIDPIALTRAFVRNMLAGRVVQGGSTLTQQLAKNLFLTSERTYMRKVQELVLALWLEFNFSKDDILNAYLNRVYLGAGAYGIDAAARTYFGKPADALGLGEAAMIAGLLKAPSRLAPTNDMDRASDRAGLVIAAMREQGYISDAQQQAALRAPVGLVALPAGANAGYVVDWIASRAWDLAGGRDRDIVVRSTIDPRAQTAAETRVRDLLEGPGALVDVGQAAVVVMRPDGSVAGMVGGRSHQMSRFNRATQALRQPGSAFKPFVYLAALRRGYTPTSLVEDAAISIGGYAPTNFDGRFRGVITLERALADSVNTVAVRLLSEVGVDTVATLARDFGLTAAMRGDLSLALGTSEVSPLALATAYAGLLRGGRPVSPHGVTEIRTADGTPLYRRAAAAQSAVIDRALVAELSGMLATVIDRGSGRTARLDRPAAGKTGTTQGFRDAWFAGYTADYVTVVWLGNDDGAPMDKVTGGGLAAALWRDIMLDIHAGLPAKPLPDLFLRQPAVTVGGPAAIPAAPLPPAATAPPPAETGRGGGGLGGLLRRLLGN